MTTMRVVGECFFWYRLTRVFPDKFHRAVKRLCVVLSRKLSVEVLNYGFKVIMLVKEQLDCTPICLLTCIVVFILAGLCTDEIVQ